jgi:hypothetical protein
VGVGAARYVCHFFDEEDCYD